MTNRVLIPDEETETSVKLELIVEYLKTLKPAYLYAEPIKRLSLAVTLNKKWETMDPEIAAKPYVCPYCGHLETLYPVMRRHIDEDCGKSREMVRRPVEPEFKL